MNYRLIKIYDKFAIQHHHTDKRLYNCDASGWDTIVLFDDLTEALLYFERYRNIKDTNRARVLAKKRRVLHK